MEIVIGVILLVGAFALGHNTADQEALQAQARLENEQAEATAAGRLSVVKIAVTVSADRSAGFDCALQPATASRANRLRFDAGCVPR